MQFRIRKNTAQLVRTTAAEGENESSTKIVGRLSLASLQITEELQKNLTAEELDEAKQWIAKHQHLIAIKEELAALQLADNIDMARRWLKKEGKQSLLALRVAAEIRDSLQPLRKALKSMLDDELSAD